MKNPHLYDFREVILLIEKIGRSHSRRKRSHLCFQDFSVAGSNIQYGLGVIGALIFSGVIEAESVTSSGHCNCVISRQALQQLKSSVGLP